MVPYFDTADSKSYADLHGEDYIRHHRGAADKYPPKYTLVQKHLVSRSRSDRCREIQSDIENLISSSLKILEHNSDMNIWSELEARTNT